MKHISGIIFNHKVVPLFALLFLCIICYSNSINSPFVFDDYPNIVDNKSVHVDEVTLENLYSAGSKKLSPV